MVDFSWAPHIPLIGGLPIGMEMAFGKAPEEIFSLPGFYGNDKHYHNYQNVTLGRSLKYTPIEPDDISFDRKINVIVGTPPCAALSQLNTGKTVEAKGAGCAKNEFMLMVFRHGIKKFQADVIIVENAPALSTTKGAPVADALFDLCQENDYSFTLYKTSTHFHGIPQRRDRTFAIAWRTKEAPIMDWCRTDRKGFADYLQEVPSNAMHHNEIINPKLTNCLYWTYINEKLGGNARDTIAAEKQVTAFNYISKTGQLDEAAAWIRENHPGTRGEKLVEHAIGKLEKGLGIWDGSVHVFTDVMNAYIGRNANDTVHPTEDRSLTVREGMHMMGLPHDFELLGGKKNHNHICQNVPTCTAKFIGEQVIKFMNGELPSSGSVYIKQDNWTRKTKNLIAEEPVNLESLVS